MGRKAGWRIRESELQRFLDERDTGVADAMRGFQRSRATVYRWRNRYDPTDLCSLRPRSGTAKLAGGAAGAGTSAFEEKHSWTAGLQLTGVPGVAWPDVGSALRAAASPGDPSLRSG